MSAWTCFAACTKGLETVLADELRALGAARVTERRGGVQFEADREVAYAANLWLRSAVRVQEQLVRARAWDGDELYDVAASIDWSRLIRPDQTLAVSATTRDTPELRHAGFAALRVKDAIVDVVRRIKGARPSVDTQRPDLRVKLVVQHGTVLLYRDLSGTSLHKRGWRPIQVKSPLNEATAAGLLLATGWHGTTPLVDPMCGSGTFPIEAACLAMDRAPGLERTFAFERFPDFDAALWDGMREAARTRVRSAPPAWIAGSDHHPGALGLARQGAEAAGVASAITWTQAPVGRYQPPGEPKLVVVNPPYGERLGDEADLEGPYRDLGTFLHERCPGATAWVLSGNKALTRFLRLKTSRRMPVMNGPIECRWLKYELRSRDP